MIRAGVHAIRGAGIIGAPFQWTGACGAWHSENAAYLTVSCAQVAIFWPMPRIK